MDEDQFVAISIFLLVWIAYGAVYYLKPEGILGRFHLLSGWLKDSATENILYITFTLDTFQLLSDWLKDIALSNIPCIFVTLDTFQLLSGWLKEFASQNIHFIVVTLDTFHLLSGWLKARRARRWSLPGGPWAPRAARA